MRADHDCSSSRLRNSGSSSGATGPRGPGPRPTATATTVPAGGGIVDTGSTEGDVESRTCDDHQNDHDHPEPLRQQPDLADGARAKSTHCVDVQREDGDPEHEPTHLDPFPMHPKASPRRRASSHQCAVARRPWRAGIAAGPPLAAPRAGRRLVAHERSRVPRRAPPRHRRSPARPLGRRPRSRSPISRGPPRPSRTPAAATRCCACWPWSLLAGFLYLVGMRGWLLAFSAVLISGVISLFLFMKQRNDAALNLERSVADWRHRHESEPGDADLPEE